MASRKFTVNAEKVMQANLFNLYTNLWLYKIPNIYQNHSSKNNKTKIEANTIIDRVLFNFLKSEYL